MNSAAGRKVDQDRRIREAFAREATRLGQFIRHRAMGLLVLTRILVGRVGRGPGHWGWRGRMRQDWQRMTPEEREKLRATFSRRCGGRGMPESEPKA
jgi:hypothetical protein